MLRNQPLSIFIGYDSETRVTWHTLAHSLIENSSIPISLHPVNLDHYGSFFNRKRDPKQSNSFSFSRFCVPYLMDYQGLALFMDSDMLIRDDIALLLKEIENQESKAVHLVKHDYNSENSTKFHGKKNYKYPRKNWSSFVVWNCSHPKNRILTPDFFNTASGLQLHRFTWLSDNEIGELNIRWNWLVGDYKNTPDDVKNVHWSIGGPYFDEYKDVEFSEEWFSANDMMNFCKQTEK